MGTIMGETMYTYTIKDKYFIFIVTRNKILYFRTIKFIFITMMQGNKFVEKNNLRKGKFDLQKAKFNLQKGECR